jgi:hypothetical protein
VPRVQTLSTPLEASPGQNISVRLGLVNENAWDMGPFSIDLFLCSGQKIDPVHDIILKHLEVDRLASMAAFERAITVRIPSDMEPGIYTLGALLDTSGVVSQVDAINDAIGSSRELRIVK